MSASAVQVEREPVAPVATLPGVAALSVTSIVGLIAAAMLAWGAHYAFFVPTRLLPAAVRNFAAFYVLLTLGAGWGVTRGVLTLMGEESSARELPLRVGLTSTWVAPTLLLLFDHSEWAVLAVSALTASAFRLAAYVLSIGREPLPDADIALPEPPGLFTSARLSQAGPDFFGAICAALLVQGTAAAIAAAKLLLAAGLALLAVYVLFRCMQPTLVTGPAGEPPRPLSQRRISTRLSLAALLTLMALLPHMVLPGRFSGQNIGGGSYSLISALKALFGLWGTGSGSPLGSVPAVEASGGNRAIIRRPGTPYPAVVIWSDEPHNVMPLVAPPPLTMEDEFGTHRDNPLTIRFDGQYLVLRSADQKPGPDSLVQYGSPAKQRFVSNDYTPLWMEARQNLGSHLDRRCCRAIRLTITDADPGSRMVDLEVVLTDTQMKQHGSQTLGVQHVTNDDNTQRPVDRTIMFDIPAEGLQRFDQVTVRYWLNRWHRYQSAKVAIKEFVWVPR